MFGFLTNKIYFFNNIQTQQPPAQYVHAIMWYDIEYNIVDFANKLFFAYWGLVTEFSIFVSSSIKSIKATDFIHAFKEK